MRIAIVSDWFLPRRGGIEMQLGRLAERLAGAGHELDVVTSTPAAVHGPGYRVLRLPVATLPGSQVAVGPALLASMRRTLQTGYDVVHAHVSVVSPVGYAAALTARRLGVPVVLTFHSVLRYKRYVLAFVDRLLGLTRGDVVFSAVSRLVADQVRAALGGGDVSLLPNGIDLGFWSAAARLRTADASTVTLVSTMRLQRKKRPAQLIRAFREACRRARTPVRLVIAGDGPLRGALERSARVAGAEVVLAGWRNPAELRDLYARADVFVLPSSREAFGIAALEARAAGLPVVARIAGSAEFLVDGENALLCDSDAALARAMALVIDDAGLRIRLAAGETRLHHYDWPAVIAAHEALYVRAITSRGPALAAASV